MNVVFSKEAELEYLESFYWYHEQSTKVAISFESSLETLINKIKRQPHIYPQVEGSGLRKAVLHSFPFTVFYSLEVDYIFIASIFHQKRNPKY